MLLRHAACICLPAVLAAVTLGAACGGRASPPGRGGSTDRPAPTADKPPGTADELPAEPGSLPYALDTYDRLKALVEGIQRVSTDGLRRLGTDWPTELARSRERFRTAQTDSDLYYAILSLQRSYHDGHGALDGGALTPKTPAVLLKLRVEALYDQAQGGAPRFVVVDSGEPAVPVGHEILTVDGQPVQQLMTAWREWHRSSSPEGLADFTARSLAYRPPQDLPAPAPGTEVRLGVAAPSGAASTAALRWEAEAAAPLALQADSCRIPQADTVEQCYCSDGSADQTCLAAFAGAQSPGRFDEQFAALRREASGRNFELYGTRAQDVKILRYTSFDYDDEQAMRTAVAEIRSHLDRAGARKVLVDVRENGGGVFVMDLVELFTAAPYEAMAKSFYFGSYLKAQPSAFDDQALMIFPEHFRARWKAESTTAAAGSFSARIPFFCKTEACDLAETRYVPQPGRRVFEAALLTGPDCFSSCDLFVSIMKDNGIARLVGMPSAAGDSPLHYSTDFALPDGRKVGLQRLTTGVSYRPKTPGVILEGNPPAVDVPLYPTRTSRERYLDEALRALGWVP